MPVQALTDRFVRHVKTDQAVEEYRDQGFPGFGLRLTRAGRKTFFVVYPVGARRRRLSLGRYPIVGLAEARKKARLALSEVDKGRDPQGDRFAARQGASFTDLAEQYMSLYAENRHSPAWLAYERGVLDNHLLPALGNFRVGDLRRSDIVLVLDGIATRHGVLANRVRAILSGIFNWAMARELVEVNPVAGVPKPAKELSRERVLSEEELRKVWLTCEAEGSLVSRSMQLVLLTAQRGGEVRAMRWGDIDRDWWTIPRAKSGLSHRVYLSPPALAILEELSRRSHPMWVFPASRGASGHLGRSGAGPKRIRRASGVDGWTVHDLRRTAATMMASMGVSPFVVEKILGHADRRGVTAIYDRSSYDADKRKALIRWSRSVEQIVSGERPQKVVSIR